jgi:hypothetical protein
MAVEAHWDNDEKTVIRYETYGRWTNSEFWTAYDQARAMLEAVDHKVYFILIGMDAQSMNHIPNGFITHIGSIFRNAHPRAGLVIVVRQSQGLLGQIYERIIAKTLPQILSKFDFAESLEEARAKLAKQMKTDQARQTANP